MSKKYVITQLYDTEEEAESARILLMGKFSSLIEKILISPMPYGSVLQIDTNDISESQSNEIKAEIEPPGQKTNTQQEKPIEPTVTEESEKPAEKEPAKEPQPKTIPSAKHKQAIRTPITGKSKRIIPIVYLFLVLGSVILALYAFGIFDKNSKTENPADNSSSLQSTITYTSSTTPVNTGTTRTTVTSSTPTLSSPGTLTVKCNQTGASIYVGNQLVGTTDDFFDTTASGLASGTYTLKITEAGFKDWSKQITIVGNQTTTIYVYLEAGTGTSTIRAETISPAAAYGSLDMHCNQTGGNIYIGTEFEGTTDDFFTVTANGLLPGTYTLKITEAGFKDWIKQITIAAKQTTTVYAYLENGSGASATRNETILPAAAYGSLDMHCNQTGGNIYIGTEFEGTTDDFFTVTANGLLPGTYTLKITEAGFKDWFKQVTIAAKQTTTVYAYLENGSGASTTRNETIPPAATYGSISVHCNQTGGSIYVDNEFEGTTDNFFTITANGLLPGTHTVKITESGYQDWTGQVTIAVGQTASITVALIK